MKTKKQKYADNGLCHARSNTRRVQQHPANNVHTLPKIDIAKTAASLQTNEKGEQKTPTVYETLKKGKKCSLSPVVQSKPWNSCPRRLTILHLQSAANACSHLVVFSIDKTRDSGLHHRGRHTRRPKSAPKHTDTHAEITSKEQPRQRRDAHTQQSRMAVEVEVELEVVAGRVYPLHQKQCSDPHGEDEEQHSIGTPRADRCPLRGFRQSTNEPLPHNRG